MTIKRDLNFQHFPYPVIFIISDFYIFLQHLSTFIKTFKTKLLTKNAGVYVWNHGKAWLLIYKQLNCTAEAKRAS